MHIDKHINTEIKICVCIYVCIHTCIYTNNEYYIYIYTYINVHFQENKLLEMTSRDRMNCVLRCPQRAGQMLPGTLQKQGVDFRVFVILPARFLGPDKCGLLIWQDHRIPKKVECNYPASKLGFLSVIVSPRLHDMSVSNPL